MPRESTVQPYLTHFGARNALEIEDGIVRKVRAHLEAPSTLTNLPIRLAEVVHKFGIEARPLFTSDVANGQLRYDNGTGLFRIAINPKHDRRRPRLYDDDVQAMGAMIKGRLRFTYAHEFAHRFFFIETAAGQRRLLDTSLCNTTGADRSSRERTLHDFEEALCDRVAARLLIPDDVMSVITSDISAAAPTSHLYDVIAMFAERLAVTRECLLVRVARAIRLGRAPWPDDRACFLIAQSNRSGARRQAQRELRMTVLLTARDGVFRSSYPGMPVGRFGTGLHELASSLLQDRSLIQIINPIRLGQGGLAPLFSGYAHRTAGIAPQLLIGGLLNAASKEQDF